MLIPPGDKTIHTHEEAADRKRFPAKTGGHEAQQPARVLPTHHRGEFAVKRA